jgi:hypothetical protein
MTDTERADASIDEDLRASILARIILEETQPITIIQPA